MDSADDPYEILGVSPDTDEKELKKAYRKLAMQYHPDKQHSEEDKEMAHNMFARIAAAYEVVSDPSKRHDWDMLRQESSASVVTARGRRRPVKRTSNGTSPHRARSTNTTPVRQRSTNSPPNPNSPPRNHSPPPPSSPGLFRARPKPQRTGSPSKTRELSPGVPNGRHQRSGSFAGPPSNGFRPRTKSRDLSPGAVDGARHSPHRRSVSNFEGPPISPGTLRPRHTIAVPQSPGGSQRGVVGAPTSPGALAARARHSEMIAPPQSPGTIRPQGRPRPRPVGDNGGKEAPRKHASTGTLRTRPRNSTGTLAPRPGADGDPAMPRRQMSAGTLRRKFRDPFLIFDQVMEEEFGKGYKSKAASGWNKDEEGKEIGGDNKKLSAKKEFKKLDLNGDEVLSKDELRKFIESHEELWAVLGNKLNLKRETCIRIATEVAFSLAKGEDAPKKRKSTVEANSFEISEAEFKTFCKNYVQSQKGSYDFFLRTIFAFYDINGDGVLQRDEFLNFLDLFYKAKDTYKQKMENMPTKQNLLRIAEARLDRNKDGELSFEEVRDMLQVAAVITGE